MSNKIAAIARTALLALLTGTAAGSLVLGLAAPADASAGGVTYGDPTATAKWWRLQTYDDCAIMAGADIVGQMTGSEPSERAIIEVARTTPSTRHPGSIYIKPNDPTHPNSGNGTSRLDIPTLLAHYGVGSKTTDDDEATRNGIATGMDALKHYLGSRHAVMVSLNAEMIWGEPIESKDDEGNPVSDHAVVVTGVDTRNGIVHLNDSGNENGRDEQIPLELFAKAWATSHHFLLYTVATVK